MTLHRSIIHKITGDPKMSFFIVLLVMVVRFFQLQFYLDSFFDTSFQVIATQNLVAGHGISTAIVQPADLSNIIYQPLINWPPGYSLLLTPFYQATGGNHLMACFILEMLSTLSIILLCRKILSLLAVEDPIINAFTLLTGFFIYYFYYTGSTDSVSVAFFLAAIYYSLLLLQSAERIRSRALIAGFLLLISASLKYLFFPLVFLLPFFLLLYAVQNRNQLLRRAAWIMLFVTALGVGSLYVYQKMISGAGTYISASGRGFFPEHLLRAHPFIPGAFVTPNTIRKLPTAVSGNLLNGLRILHLLLLIGLAVIALLAFLKKGFRAITIQQTFLYLALLIGLAINLELAALSLLVDKELIPPDRWWTYVEDARYYGLGDVLVHLSVFMAFAYYRKKWSGSLKWLTTLLPFLLLPEALRGLRFTVNRIQLTGKESYYWKEEEKFFRYGQGIALQKMKEKGTRQLVVTGSLYYGNYRASLKMEAPVMEDIYALNQPDSLQCKEPVLILAMIKDDQRKLFEGFISNPVTELAGVYNGFYFYTLYVSPR